MIGRRIDDAKLISETSDVSHGGNVDWATAVFGKPSDGWLDLSTGINPHPYAFSKVDDNWWHQLPTASQNQELCCAAAQYFKVIDPNCVVAVPGSQAAIQLLPRLRTRTKVAVVSPTYGEHCVVWQAAGHDVSEVLDLDEVANDVSVVVVTNPNNPDGRLISRNRIMEWCDFLAARGGWLVVDEAFADVVPEESVSSESGREGLVVLRSFGKFFGLAGLRLGFVLAPFSLADKILGALGPWAVNGPALAIAAEALADRSWQSQMLHRLKGDAEKLDLILKSAGIEIIGGTPLFRLCRIATATLVFETLAKSGVLVRRFDDQPDLLRFGLPGSEEQWHKLQRVIAGLIPSIDKVNEGTGNGSRTAPESA